MRLRASPSRSLRWPGQNNGIQPLHCNNARFSAGLRCNVNYNVILRLVYIVCGGCVKSVCDNDIYSEMLYTISCYERDIGLSGHRIS